MLWGYLLFEKVLNKKYYSNLKGGILEAVGIMFPSNMKLYIYPTKKTEGDDVIVSQDINMDDDVKMLFNYLKENRFILDITSAMMNQLHITTRKVHKMITDGNPDWEKYVPISVANIIKQKLNKPNI